MFAGAPAGAFAVLRGEPSLPLLPAGLLVAGCTLDAFALAWSDASWTDPV